MPYFVVYIYTSEKLHYILPCNHVTIDLPATHTCFCEGCRAHLEVLENFSWISPVSETIPLSGIRTALATGLVIYQITRLRTIFLGERG